MASNALMFELYAHLEPAETYGTAGPKPEAHVLRAESRDDERSSERTVTKSKGRKETEKCAWNAW